LRCGHFLDSAAAVTKEKPKPKGPRAGDLTVCIDCGHVMAFDAKIKLRNLTRTEQRRAAKDRNVRLVQRAIAELDLEFPERRRKHGAGTA
jgi:hypothetical protein